jgi:beta-fructofuranosidase
MGDWWYLVFSTFTDKFATHYRMSRSSTGPWITPVIDTWDARGFYAAKTAFNSSGRFAFGWVPTKEGNNDFGEWQWGGTIVVHQIAQDSDGRLFPKIPDSIYRAFRRTVTPMMTSYLGKVKAGSNEIAIGGTDEISHAIFDDLSDHCMIEGRLEFSTGIRSFGVDIRMDSTLENGYFFRFEPFYNRLVFDRWPRREFAGADQSMGGERQFVVELERPLSFACLTEVRFKLILDGEVCVIYVNDTTALSTRVYNLNRNRKWSLFSQGGEIIANELAIKSF